MSYLPRVVGAINLPPVNDDRDVIGGKATDGVPAAFSDGDVGDIWLGLLGQLMCYGANLAENSQDTSVVNPASMIPLNVTNLNAVVAATDGTGVDIENYARKTVFVNVSVNTGAVTVNIETSDDNTNWYDFWTKTYTAATGKDTHSFSEHFPYIRTTTTTQSNSTVTTVITGRGQ